MVSRFILSFVLSVAGVLHLISPQLFDPAIPFDLKFEINLMSGIFEIILSIGLWVKPFRDFFARLTALWFLFLTPIHIYVSWFEIPIFGVSHPLLLWARTGFQFVLFFWALSLQEKGWIISQAWSDVLFMHYEVDPKKLQDKIPYPLDLFEGKAVVSIVPFEMGGIRFPFLPTIPGLSRLYELNLRTYVKIGNRPLVYFMTLDANHLIGVLIARTFFRLPYRWRKMKLRKEENYMFESDSLQIVANIEDTSVETEFDRWTTERYALVTKFAKRDLVGFVDHRPWDLKRVQIKKIENNFSAEFIELKQFLGASYAKNLKVRFRPFAFYREKSFN